jgi:hypothetical protein
MNNENTTTTTTTTAVAVEAVEAIEVGAVKEVGGLTPAWNFKENAMLLAARGIPVIPLRPREKGAVLEGWPNLATTDLTRIAKWNQQNAQYNVGAVAKLDGFWMLDCDVLGLPQTIEKETGEVFPPDILCQVQ